MYYEDNSVMFLFSFGLPLVPPMRFELRMCHIPLEIRPIMLSVASGRGRELRDSHINGKGEEYQDNELCDGPFGVWLRGVERTERLPSHPIA